MAVMHVAPTEHQTPVDEIIGVDWSVGVEVDYPEKVDPRHLHAVISARLDDPSSGRVADLSIHRAASKSFAIGPLWEVPDGGPGISIRTLGEAHSLPSEDQSIQLGRQLAIVRWSQASVTRAVSLSELRLLEPASSVLVRFDTPVTRRRGNEYLPCPTEEAILGSWERTAAKMGLGCQVDWRSSAARIVHLDGHTASWSPPKRARAKRHSPVGFVGELAIAASPPNQQRLHQLAVLATFGGTGAHTTFGMGFTSLLAVERSTQADPSDSSKAAR